MYATRVGRSAAVALVCAGALVMGGCNGGDDKEPASSPEETPTAEPVPVQAALGKVAGKLSPADAKAAVAAISPVVDGWFESAYVGGDYPRTDFADAFPGFTPGAAKDATGDQALMSNALIGAKVESVTAERKVVDVDLLATKKKQAAGATARFTLVFTTTGAAAKKVTVKGRLFLTPKAGDAWQVFGYNVTRTAR
ncbi:conserved exported hypothetical protein [metagenome]|uniref:Lipoprotein n=1 Tax=metagenome TaxID=256318 RepID=A0A2P2C1N8_9ZZZZ